MITFTTQRLQEGKPTDRLKGPSKLPSPRASRKTTIHPHYKHSATNEPPRMTGLLPDSSSTWTTHNKWTWVDVQHLGGTVGWQITNHMLIFLDIHRREKGLMTGIRNNIHRVLMPRLDGVLTCPQFQTFALHIRWHLVVSNHSRELRDMLVVMLRWQQDGKIKYIKKTRHSIN